MKIPFKIDTNVPLPQPRRLTEYRFADMKIGDSFLGVHGAIAAAGMFGQRREPKWKFKSRLVKKDVYRIWRVA